MTINRTGVWTTPFSGTHCFNLSFKGTRTARTFCWSSGQHLKYETYAISHSAQSSFAVTDISLWSSVWFLENSPFATVTLRSPFATSSWDRWGPGTAEQGCFGGQAASHGSRHATCLCDVWKSNEMTIWLVVWNIGKTMAKPWENHGKMVIYMENHNFLMGKSTIGWWFGTWFFFPIIYGNVITPTDAYFSEG